MDWVTQRQSIIVLVSVWCPLCSYRKNCSSNLRDPAILKRFPSNIAKLGQWRLGASGNLNILSIVRGARLTPMPCLSHDIRYVFWLVRGTKKINRHSVAGTYRLTLKPIILDS